MTYETIRYEQQGRTACVTLDRPEVLNAINDTMGREVDEVFRAIDADDSVWTVIITGTGRALCSGADVNKASTFDDADDFQFGIDVQGEPMLGTMRQWDPPQEATPPYLQTAKPIICAVNGIAAGAGLDLVTTCDIAIAADNATFFDPHVSIGVVGGRECARLARVLPMGVAMRVALMGKHERLTAERAYELGLVTEVVPLDQLMPRAWEIADTINKNAPLAVRGARMAIRKGIALPIYEAELLAENYRMKVAVTQDASEGPKAFLEKREPEWRAR